MSGMKWKKVKVFKYAVGMLLVGMMVCGCGKEEANVVDESVVESIGETNIQIEESEEKDESLELEVDYWAQKELERKADEGEVPRVVELPDDIDEDANFIENMNIYEPLPEILNATFADGLVQIDGHIYQYDYNSAITVSAMCNSILENGNYYFDYTGEELISPHHGETIGVYKESVCVFKFTAYNETEEIVRLSECLVSHLDLMGVDYRNQQHDTSIIFYAKGLCANGNNINYDNIGGYLGEYEYEFDYNGDGYQIRIDEPMGSNSISRHYRFYFDEYGNGTGIEIYP